MPDSTISAQLKQLAKWGEAGAIQSIENSIAGKWQGLFQPKPTSGQASNQKQTKTNSVHEMGLS
jgi:hypothetical protein